MKEDEKFISGEKIYDGRIITVTRDKVELRNGRVAEREVVRHNGGACILAIDDGGDAYFVEQYRYPFKKKLLELPAGKIEKGEKPECTAARELREECGLNAKNLESLGVLYPTVAYCTEIIYMYYATEFSVCGQNPDEDEFLNIVKIPFKKAVEMVKNNEIPDAKTQIAVLKAAALRGEL